MTRSAQDRATGSQTVEHVNSFLVKAQNKFSFAEIAALASGGVVEILKIPAKAYVERVVLRIDTVEGGTATADVGDGDDPNGYLDHVDLDATAGDVFSSIKLTDNYAEGHYYPDADTIDISLDNNMDAGIYTISAIYFIVE